VKIRIGLAQMDPALGLLARNLEAHLDWVERARREKVELLVFPELSLTGYQLKDMVPDMSREADHPDFAPLLEASRDMDICFGFVERSRDLRHFNSLAYAAGGELLHVHRKVYLPTYGMFDEQRYFAPGDTIRAFETRFGPLAMVICEDLWHPSLLYLAFLDGALGVLGASASPVFGMEHVEPEGLPENTAWWDRLLRQHAGLYGGFLAYCNRCGGEDGTLFWGGSRLIGPAGELVVGAELHEPSLSVGEIDLKAVGRRRQRFSMLRDERPEVTFRTLERIMRSRVGLEEKP
jgi:predicted amidohydrolase